ncbi:hypothetical protein BDR03DRAFT_1011625 [Suillus americanus]|nr:hypothetical protein BDR03DRAFT_1011625 [Suillus americanus]
MLLQYVIPPGPSHSALGKQVATLVADVVKEYGSRDGPLPGLIISCSKELLCIWNMVPKVWPDWHSIGYDDPRILRHAWYPKALAWKALGDPTFDLPTAAPPIHRSHSCQPSLPSHPCWQCCRPFHQPHP